MAAAATALKTETVWVGCKMPSGLRLDVMKVHGKDKDGALLQTRHVGPTLRGNALSMHPEAMANNPVLIDGYAFTEIDAEHWKAWFDANKGGSIVLDGLVILAGAESDKRAAARDHAAVKAMAPRIDQDAIEREYKLKRATPNEV